MPCSRCKMTTSLPYVKYVENASLQMLYWHNSAEMTIYIILQHSPFGTNQSQCDYICRWIDRRIHIKPKYSRADSRFAPNQFETTLYCNDVSHWLWPSLESALFSLYHIELIVVWEYVGKSRSVLWHSGDWDIEHVAWNSFHVNAGGPSL